MGDEKGKPHDHSKRKHSGAKKKGSHAKKSSSHDKGDGPPRRRVHRGSRKGKGDTSKEKTSSTSGTKEKKEKAVDPFEEENLSDHESESDDAYDEEGDSDEDADSDQSSAHEKIEKEDEDSSSGFPTSSSISDHEEEITVEKDDSKDDQKKDKKNDQKKDDQKKDKKEDLKNEKIEGKSDQDKPAAAAKVVEATSLKEKNSGYVSTPSPKSRVGRKKLAHELNKKSNSDRELHSSQGIRLTVSGNNQAGNRKSLVLSPREFLGPGRTVRARGISLTQPESARRNRIAKGGRSGSRAKLETISSVSSMMTYGDGDTLDTRNDFYAKFRDYAAIQRRRLDHTSLLLGQEQFADTFISLPDDSQRLAAHEFVLRVRCPLLNAAANAKRRKPGDRVELHWRQIKTVITKKHTEAPSFACLSLILNYIYTDVLPFDRMSPSITYWVYVHALNFRLERLAQLCMRHLQEEGTITVDTFFDLMKLSKQVRDPEVFRLCLTFAKKNIATLMVERKDATKQLGIELVQELAMASLASSDGESKAEDGAEEDEMPLVEVEASTYEEDWKTILRDTEDQAERRHADAFVRFGERRIWFHRAMLCAYVPSLTHALDHLDGTDATSILVTPFDKDANTLPRKRGMFEMLFRFIYIKDCGLEGVNIVHLFEFARIHQYEELQTVCEYLMGASFTPQTAIAVLKCTYLQANAGNKSMLDLREKAVRYIVCNLVDIDLRALLLLCTAASVDILEDIQSALRNGELVTAASLELAESDCND